MAPIKNKPISAAAVAQLPGVTFTWSFVRNEENPIAITAPLHNAVPLVLPKNRERASSDNSDTSSDSGISRRGNQISSGRPSPYDLAPVFHEIPAPLYARFLKQAGERKRILPIVSNIGAAPVGRPPGKRVYPFAAPQHRLPTPPQVVVPAPNSFSSPTKPSVKTERRQRRVDSFSSMDDGDFIPSSPSKVRPAKNVAISHPGDFCRNCGVTSTSQWRKGELGNRTLCNACGLGWAKEIRHEAKTTGLPLLEAEQHLIRRKAKARAANETPSPAPAAEKLPSSE